MEITKEDLLAVLRNLDTTEKANTFRDDLLKRIDINLNHFKEMKSLMPPSIIQEFTWKFFHKKLEKPVSNQHDNDLINMILIGLAMFDTIQEYVINALEEKNKEEYKWLKKKM